MPTLYVENTKIELTLDQLIDAVQLLSPRERQIVRRALDEDWAAELDDLLARVHARFQADPMDDDELDAEIEAARDAYYTHRSH
jgi:hypothetical protein